MFDTRDESLISFVRSELSDKNFKHIVFGAFNFCKSDHNCNEVGKLKSDFNCHSQILGRASFTFVKLSTSVGSQYELLITDQKVRFHTNCFGAQQDFQRSFILCQSSKSYLNKFLKCLNVASFTLSLLDISAECSMFSEHF